MHAAVKILIGLILIAIGLGMFIDSVWPIFGTPILPVNWLENFIIVLTGIIPAFLILIGLFVVWLEVDEIKAEREIRAEEEKEKAKQKESKKK